VKAKENPFKTPDYIIIKLMLILTLIFLGFIRQGIDKKRDYELVLVWMLHSNMRGGLSPKIY